MLQCVAVCCSVLQCVAVSCSVSQSDLDSDDPEFRNTIASGVLHCVAVCCSVLQCVAVY